MISAAFFASFLASFFDLHSSQFDPNGFVLGIQFPPADLAYNDFRYLPKYALYILASLGRAFHEMKTILLGTIEALVIGDVPPSIDSILLRLQVLLVAYQESGDFIIGVGFGLIKPFADVVERFSISEVVGQNHSD